MNHSDWIRTAFVSLALLIFLPAAGLSDGACGCEDLCNLAKRLKEKERLLDAAKKVAEEAKDKVFPTSAWAKKRFKEIAFPTGKYKVEGEQKYGEPVKVSEEMKKGKCEGQWKATEAHELDHDQYDKTVPDWKYPWIMIFGQEGEFLAGKEVSGHMAEVEYLRKEIEKLLKNCPPVDCDPEPVAEQQPALETYQENNEAARAEQAQRVAGSSRRVKGYAKSIQ